MEKIGDSMKGGRSFGPAFERDGTMVIPVAYVFGGGGGGGSDKTPEGQQPPKAGSGGGFGFVSWPIGAYVIKNGEVTWRPLFDIHGILMLVLGVVRLLIKVRQRKR